MGEICGYCGKEVEETESTPFHEPYCADCIAMNIEFDRDALRKMKTWKRRKKISKEELARLKKEKDDALRALGLDI